MHARPSAQLEPDDGHLPSSMGLQLAEPAPRPSYAAAAVQPQPAQVPSPGELRSSYAPTVPAVGKPSDRWMTWAIGGAIGLVALVGLSYFGWYLAVDAPYEVATGNARWRSLTAEGLRGMVPPRSQDCVRSPLTAELELGDTVFCQVDNESLFRVEVYVVPADEDVDVEHILDDVLEVFEETECPSGRSDERVVAMDATAMCGMLLDDDRTSEWDLYIVPTPEGDWEVVFAGGNVRGEELLTMFRRRFRESLMRR